jgi:hypothetical protein
MTRTSPATNTRTPHPSVADRIAPQAASPRPAGRASANACRPPHPGVFVLITADWPLRVRRTCLKGTSSAASVRQCCEVIGDRCASREPAAVAARRGRSRWRLPGPGPIAAGCGSRRPARHLERVVRADRQPARRARPRGQAGCPPGFAQKPGQRIVEAKLRTQARCPRISATAPARARFSLSCTRTRAGDAPVISSLIAL